MTPEESVQWPTLRSKLWPITVIRLPRWYWLPNMRFRNWYYGRWWQLEFGCWLILGGACEIRDDEGVAI